MMARQSFTMGLLVLGVVITAVVLGVVTVSQQKKPDLAIEGLLWPPKVLAPFTAVDHRNEPFGLSDLHGKWSFLFFGYTHCPDICPVTLPVMDKVHERLEQGADKPGLQTIFISVDPERDTPERLAQYVTYFNPEFIGLGGSIEQVSAITGQIGVAYFLNKSDDAENYLVDHSSPLFLIDPQGRLLTIFSAPHDARAIADKFTQIRKFISG